MTWTIDQYMWSHQPFFRVSLETLAKFALESAGAHVAPLALLVGFAAKESATHAVCVEPENKAFSQGDLSAVVAATESAVGVATFDGGYLISDPGESAAHERLILDGARGRALCEALAAAPGGRDRLFFAGPGRPVGDYVVYPVLGVLAVLWERLPALACGLVDGRHQVARSLQHAVVEEVLAVASDALALREPPSRIGADHVPVLRAASERLVAGTATRVDQWDGSGLHAALDGVAAQPYEGRSGAGAVVLSRPGSASVETRIAFDVPVSTRDGRAFRKALEMTGPGLALLCDGLDVTGLGTSAAGYDPASEDRFVANVVGRGSWELHHVDTPLLRVDDGRPRLPSERLSRDRFDDTVARVFPDSPPDGAGLLWRAAMACAAQAHGTMLVVHADAAAEARRLAPQAVRITPTPLDDHVVASVTGIDGAVLMSPDGRCHAVGVILDRVAVTGTGDSSRGARYNSAVRYVHGRGAGVLAIIVSEDGMIDLLPRLRRRVTPRTVDEVVRNLTEAAAGEVDHEDFARADRHVASLAFYLDQAQCDAVNAARERANAQRGTTSVGYPHMRPDPDMDASHWLDDPVA